MANHEKKRGRGRPPGAQSDKSRSADRHKKTHILRLLPDMYERLKRVAELNDRDATQEGRRAIKFHLETEEGRLGIRPSSKADDGTTR